MEKQITLTVEEAQAILQMIEKAPVVGSQAMRTLLALQAKIVGAFQQEAP